MLEILKFEPVKRGGNQKIYRVHVVLSEYFSIDVTLDVPTIGVRQQGGRRRFYSIAGVTPQLAIDDDGAANIDDLKVVKSALVI